MFTAADNLGESNMTPYKSTVNPRFDVSFVPIKQPNGRESLVALAGHGEDIGLPIDTICTSGNINTNDNVANSGTEFSQLYKKGEIYATPTPNEDDDENAKRNIFVLGNDPVNVFYIGSITVVGLYILFRILSKTK
jgi:GTPase